jgi:hypothetical protein
MRQRFAIADLVTTLGALCTRDQRHAPASCVGLIVLCGREGRGWCYTRLSNTLCALLSTMALYATGIGTCHSGLQLLIFSVPSHQKCFCGCELAAGVVNHAIAAHRRWSSICLVKNTGLCAQPMPITLFGLAPLRATRAIPCAGSVCVRRSRWVCDGPCLDRPRRALLASVLAKRVILATSLAICFA